MESKTKRLAMAASAAAVIAAGFEGLRQYAYYDPRPGDAILTVCYGSTTQVEKGKKYSLEECKQRLDADMLEAVSTVERCHPNLPDNVLIAFADAVYNIGPKVACKSTASKYLSTGDYDKACKELPKWNKSNGVVLPGLTKRRKAEMEICLGSATN
jgi:GH24 family phage-related lysozyme (muramidase)